MTHLLAIAVGPVQEFIAAARRTRDLWFGSYLLSEVSRAVAVSVEVNGGKLIFPASIDMENVANVILAELPSGDPAMVATTAKQAARDCWKSFAEQAKKDAGNALRPEVWAEQVDDVIEFYAAWLRSTGDYAADRRKVMRVLAGRKNCRDFTPAQGRAGVPKSSLDGQRETVLRRDERLAWPRRLRLCNGEQLDVVGVTKRLGKKSGESHPNYASVARVAAETWLQGARNHAKFDDLYKACEAVRNLNRVREQNYQFFPFEGTVVFPARHPDLVEELGPEVKRPLDNVAKLVKDIGGEPNPYLAILVADGDKMGAAISALTSATAHRQFSITLSKFARAARNTVDAYHGVLVYAGGDDVLAFLPVDKCLACAGALHEQFKASLGGPTLSVGIAIGHFMENLEDLLEYGRAAEKAAKGVTGKDALAVHLHKRGGSPISVRSSWTDRPDERLARFADLIRREAIPSKLPYNLRKLSQLYRDWPVDSCAKVLKEDVLRVIRDKQPRGSRHSMSEIETLLGEGLTDAGSLDIFCGELLVARQLAQVMRRAQRRPTRTEEVMT